MKQKTTTTKTKELVTKGYKVTNEHFKCQNFQYKLNKIFEHNGTIRICNTGFHFCQVANDCFEYYTFDSKNRVFEVEAYGELITEGNKSCCGKIKFIRELTWSEVLAVVNMGKDNTGRGNTGDSNTGDWNTGDRNTGYSNTGDRNTGAFCTGAPVKILMFDKLSDWTIEDFQKSKAFQLMQNNVDIKMWVSAYQMNEEEKKAHPSWETVGGYLKDIPFKEAFKNAWHNWSEENRKAFTSLPNFDKGIFEQITSVVV